MESEEPLNGSYGCFNSNRIKHRSNGLEKGFGAGELGQGLVS
jgi:hypothetical protein